jgi:uncharacterized protein (DUF58 family)
MSFVTRYLDPALVERLNHLQVTARRVVEGSITGAHRSPLKGASVEFRQHRFYTPGDEPRRLDWRVLARTDRPYIREYDEETNLRAVLLLDASGSMAYGRPGADSKFEYGCKMVAALAYLMLGQTESVGVGLIGPRLDAWVAPRAGSAQLSRVIDVLERAAPKGESSVSRTMQETAERLGRRSLVIAVSDFFAPPQALRDGLARMRHDRHETVLLQLLDPDEAEFPFEKWSRFRGLEGERSQLCEPAAMRKIYLENFDAHRRALEETARTLGSAFHSFTTDKPVIDSIIRFVHQQMKA